MKLDLSTESSIISTTGMQEESRKKIVAKLEIQKDDIQAVLPIAKNWELMNTAVLTGRQVSQAMKVFIVSQAGKIADVTLQSSCQTEDESVIKGIKTSVGPLVSALASVQVDFSGSDSNTRSDTLQNDGAVGRDRNKLGKDLNDLEDILIGIPLKDDNGHETAAVVHSSRQHHRGNVGGSIVSSNSGMVGVFSSNKSMVHGDASTLEIGMYIVLTAFCLAIAVFVVSCVVYASKYRPVIIEANGDASVRDEH
uniref:Uncharacterized protein n=1 Tax=Anopheles culicifacies TaxID=139723 RepID=A0A182LZA1_9DIPT